MTNRKLLLSIAVLLGMAGGARAQSDVSAQYPHWWVEAQAGASYSFGEGSFFKMLSPAGAVSAGYRFSRPVGLRVSVGGFEGKGYVMYTKTYYRFNFLSPVADVMWHPFAKLNNLYVFGGAGVLVGVKNGAQQVDVSFKPDYFHDIWKPAKAFVIGRVGAGYAFPVAEKLAVTAEAAYTLMPDAVNSKHADTPDMSVSLMAGLRYSFGPKSRKKAAAEKAAAEQAAAQLAAEQAAAERAAAEAKAKAEAEAKARAAAEKAAAEKAAAEKAAAEKAAAEKAALVAQAQALACQVYFESNSWTVRDQYKDQLNAMAEFLAQHPGSQIRLTAYCDDSYGTAAYNQLLSERRANAVAKALKKMGVDGESIQCVPSGGTGMYNKGKKISGNRVVFCEIITNN